MDQVTTVSHSDTQLPPLSHQSTPFHSHHQQSPTPTIRPPTLNLPFFDGTHPLDWLFQADQYFSFYQIPPDQRLPMVGFHMQGDALSWFKWLHNNNLLTDWNSFTRALELRFGPSTYINHQVELFKLQQTTSVTEYQGKFERLCNCVVGLTPKTILNCFISGLHTEIRIELTILNPYSIAQAIGLAKLIEDKLRDSKPKQNRFQTQPYHQLPPTSSSTHPPRPTTIAPPATHLPIKRLSSSQMQERRALGLCYNCDEKFIPGHKCTTSRFLLLLDEPISEPIEDPSPATDYTNTIHFHLSPQALTGTISPKTLKFTGLIHNLPVTVLIDSGSSHNILQPRIAHHLNLAISPNPPLSVMVGNGAFIKCQGICPVVDISLQNSTFTIPFYLLPIEGADVVLGIEWLSTLGSIQADFSIPSIAFTHNQQHITLQASNSTALSTTTYHQFCHYLSTNSIASLHLLLVEPTNSPTPITN